MITISLRILATSYIIFLFNNFFMFVVMSPNLIYNLIMVVILKQSFFILLKLIFLINETNFHVINV